MTIDEVEFLKWGFGDRLDNTVRAILAEFIVAKSLGLENLNETTRHEWGEVDIRFEDIKIEVKSSGYLQSWSEEASPIISFDIYEKLTFDEKINSWREPKKRHADVYVFCVFEEKDPQKAEPLELDQWSFYVVHTETINEK